MMGFGLVGQLMFFFLPNVTSNPSAIKKPNFQTMKKLLLNKQIIPLLTFMSFIGVILAFYSGFLHKIIFKCLTPDQQKDETLVNQYTALVFICLGVFEVVSGVSSGRLVDRHDKYTLATFGTIIGELGLVLSTIGFFLKSYTMCFFIGAIWGFADCYCNTVGQAICTKDYEGKIEIFGIYRLTLSVATAFT